MSDGRRAARLAGRIQRDLMELLVRGGAREPRLAEVVISEVRVTADLSLARIYVRSMRPTASEEERERLIEALERASGWLRRQLGAGLRVRRVPELRFAWDERIDEAARIEQLLAELRQEAPAGGEPDGEA